MRAAHSIDQEGVGLHEGEAGDVPWWSFTKLVIATAALKLVEKGSLDLDTALPGRAFTLRQLLQHEAGLSDYGWLESYHRAVASREAPWSADEAIARTFEAYPPWAPGSRWAYSNIGYYYVGELIVQMAEKSLGKALECLALAPAGLRTARVAKTTGDLDSVQMGGVRGYDPGWVLHGLIVGPIAEAAAFLHRLLSGTVLDKPMLAEMLTVHLLPQFRDELWKQPSYGLGIMGAWDGAGSPCGHSGEGPGSAIAVYGQVVDAKVRVAACWESPCTSRRAEKESLIMLAHV